MWKDLSCLQPQKKMLKRFFAFFPSFASVFIYSVVFDKTIFILEQRKNELFIYF